MSVLANSVQAEHAALRQRIIELEEREAFLRTLLSKINEIVLIFDDQGRSLEIVSGNPSVLYLSPEELPGKTLHEIFPPGQANRFLAAIQQTLKTRQSVTLEYSLTVPAGEMWFSSQIYPLNEVQVCCTLRDITVRKQTEAALISSEARYQSLVENINDVIYTLDSEGHFTYISPAIERLAQYKADDLIGQPFTLFIHPDDLNGLQESFYKTLAGDLHPYEFRVLDRNGTVHFVRTSSRPVLQDGQLVGLAGVLTDISDSWRHQEQLLENRALLQGIIDHSPAAIFVKDTQRRYLLVNQRAVNIMQMDVEKIIGKTNEELGLLPPEIARRWREEDERVVAHKQPIETEDIFFQYGEPTAFLTTLFPIYNSYGVLSAIGGISTDISERKQVEEALRKLYRAVEQSPSSVVITNTNGVIEYVNPKFSEATGYSFDEAVGQTPRLLNAGDNPREFYQTMWQTIMSGKQWRGEFHNRRKDGTLFWELASLSPIFDSDGNITHFVAVKEDITIRKTMETALRQSEARYQLLAEQNARLYQEERRRVHELDTLRTIMAEISSELDLETLLTTILDRSMVLLPSSMSIIAMYDKDQDNLVILANRGIPPNHHTDVGSRRPIGVGLLGQAARQRQAIRVADYTKWDEHIADVCLKMAHTVLAVPLLIGDTLLGVIALGDERRSQCYTEDDEQVLRLLAQHVAIAVRNAQLFDTARRRAEEAETLRHAGSVVAATLNLQEAITHILSELDRVVPHDTASVQLLRGHESEIVGGRGFHEMHRIIGLRFPITGDTPLQIVYQQRCFHILADAQATYAVFQHEPHDHIHAWMGVPLIFQDRVIGVLTLDSTMPDYFTPHHAHLVSAFADQVAIALENARLFDEVQQLARTDALTGLHNRRHFFELAYYEIARAARYRQPLSLILLDIDNFKRVNDTYGHMVGDQVLRAVAIHCRDAVRSVDIVGRYGGEEIVILVPETDIDEVCRVAERLRLNLQQSPVVTDNGTISVTASMGVATYNYPDTPDMDMLIEQADKALYIAKHTRNRVASWGREQIMTNRSLSSNHLAS